MYSVILKCRFSVGDIQFSIGTSAEMVAGLEKRVFVCKL